MTGTVIRRPDSPRCRWVRPPADAVHVLCGHCGQTVQAWPAAIGRFTLRNHEVPISDASDSTPISCPGVNTTLGHTLSPLRSPAPTRRGSDGAPDPDRSAEPAARPEPQRGGQPTIDIAPSALSSHSTGGDAHPGPAGGVGDIAAATAADSRSTP